MVDHYDWMLGLIGELGQLSESVASLKLSEGQVGEAQTSFYLGRVVLGVQSVSSAARSWLDDIDRERNEAMREAPLELDDDFMGVMQNRLNENETTLGKGHRTFPYDWPMNIKVARLLDDVDGTEGLVGWRLYLWVYVVKREIIIDVMRDPGQIDVQMSPELAHWDTDWEEPAEQFGAFTGTTIRPPVDARPPNDRAATVIEAKAVEVTKPADDDDVIMDDDDIIVDDDDDVIL